MLVVCQRELFVRVFLGLTLPPSVVASLEPLQRGLPGVRWQGAEQLHVTLRFLGELEPERLPALSRALADVSMTPFELALLGVGCFGSAQRPRVLWAGVEPEATLQRLHEAVNERLAAFDGLVEPDPFRPHVTLARPGRRPPSAEEWLRRWRDYHSFPFLVKDFALFESRLSQEGARYTVLERFALGARSTQTLRR